MAKEYKKSKTGTAGVKPKEYRKLSPKYEKIEELGFQEDDELVFDKVGVLTDDGEYESLCLVNKSLEKRMKDEN